MAYLQPCFPELPSSAVHFASPLFSHVFVDMFNLILFTLYFYRTRELRGRRYAEGNPPKTGAWKNKKKMHQSRRKKPAKRTVGLSEEPS